MIQEMLWKTWRSESPKRSDPEKWKVKFPLCSFYLLSLSQFYTDREKGREKIGKMLSITETLSWRHTYYIQLCWYTHTERDRTASTFNITVITRNAKKWLCCCVCVPAAVEKQKSESMFFTTHRFECFCCPSCVLRDQVHTHTRPIALLKNDISLYNNIIPASG